MAQGLPVNEYISANVKEPIEDLLDSVSVLLKQVQDGGTVSRNVSSFTSRESYWKTFDDSVQGISSWSIKVAVLFSKPPCPTREDVVPLLNGLEKMILSLVSTYNSLTEDQDSLSYPVIGSTLQKEALKAVSSILKSSEEFLICINKHGCKPETQQRVSQTARLSETCGQTLKTLSRDQLPQLAVDLPLNRQSLTTRPVASDNMAAVFRVLLCELQLLQDAVKELNEVGEDNGRQESLDIGEDDSDGDNCDGDGSSDGECEWSAEDKEFLAPCLEFARLVPDIVMVLSRDLVQNGRLTSVECVRDMDLVADKVQRLSPQLDNLGSAVYAPINRQQVSDLMKSLSEVTLEVLDCWKNCHFCSKNKDGRDIPSKYSEKVQQILPNIFPK